MKRFRVHFETSGSDNLHLTVDAPDRQSAIKKVEKKIQNSMPNAEWYRIKKCEKLTLY